MGRIALDAYRVSCRINKTAGQRLETFLSRIPWQKKKPMGIILSRLILDATPEQWEAIIKLFPPKRGVLAEKRRMKPPGWEEEAEIVLREVSVRAIRGGPGTPKRRY